jgi:hypothetical protein
MAKDHGPTIKDDKQYEGLRKQGMSKSRAAAIANTPDASQRGGQNSSGAPPEGAAARAGRAAAREAEATTPRRSRPAARAVRSPAEGRAAAKRVELGLRSPQTGRTHHA